MPMGPATPMVALENGRMSFWRRFGIIAGMSSSSSSSSSRKWMGESGRVNVAVD